MYPISMSISKHLADSFAPFPCDPMSTSRGWGDIEIDKVTMHIAINGHVAHRSKEDNDVKFQNDLRKITPMPNWGWESK